MGFKGIVGVDPMLDKDGNGIKMRLRPSMRKFESSEERAAQIEIAQSFVRPGTCNLNRYVLSHFGRNATMDFAGPWSCF